MWPACCRREVWMEGWPEGWVGWDEGTTSERFVSAGAKYVLYGERKGCRRAAWAIEGGAPEVDREALAMALQAAYRRTFGNDGLLWANIGDSARAGYLAEADEAIRLLSFELRVGRAELRARIEELEQSNQRLTAMANAAVARAEEAQLHAESDGSTVARVRALVERVQQDREAERLRRALDAMARGVVHMADAVSEIANGEEGAP